MRAILGYEEFDGAADPLPRDCQSSRRARAASTLWLAAGRPSGDEAGERFYNGRWMSAEDERRLAARKGWDILTEHYKIHTTCGLE